MRDRRFVSMAWPADPGAGDRVVVMMSGVRSGLRRIQKRLPTVLGVPGGEATARQASKSSCDAQSSTLLTRSGSTESAE